MPDFCERIFQRDVSPRLPQHSEWRHRGMKVNRVHFLGAQSTGLHALQGHNVVARPRTEWLHAQRVYLLAAQDIDERSGEHRFANGSVRPSDKYNASVTAHDLAIVMRTSKRQRTAALQNVA